MLSLAIKYYGMRGVIRDVNCCAWGAKVRYKSEAYNINVKNYSLYTR